MFKLLGSKRIAAYLTANLLVMCPAFVQASTGPPGNLDLNNCKKYFSDQDLAQWNSTFDPAKEFVDVWPEVEKIFDLAKNLPNPDFYNALHLALNKTWRFDANADFSECSPENTGYYNMGPATKVACQWPSQRGQTGKVAINPIRYFAYDPVTCRKPENSDELQTLQQNQKALIVHQLLLAISMDRPPDHPLANPVITEIFGLLMNPNTTAKDLQKTLYSSPFYLAVQQSLRYQRALQQPCDPPPGPATLSDQALASVSSVVAAAKAVTASSQIDVSPSIKIAYLKTLKKTLRERLEIGGRCRDYFVYNAAIYVKTPCINENAQAIAKEALPILGETNPIVHMLQNDFYKGDVVDANENQVNAKAEIVEHYTDSLISDMKHK